VTEPYTMEHHAPVKLRSIPWLVCRKCGLVYLKNPFTAWCVKHGCNSEDHPSYARQRAMTGPRI
jgi:hypothetical protein